MFLAYMDESGNTGRKNDPIQPIHMIGCILVKDSSVRAMEDDLRAIAAKHFPDVHAKRDFEFHGAELFQGDGYFKGIAPQTRVDAAIEIVKCCQTHVAAFGYGAVDKRKSYASDHPHRIAFQFLVEKLEPWLRSQDDYGLIVADEQKEVEADLLSDFSNFKRDKTTFGYINVKIERILDSVHFVRSHDSMLIQACDVLTYFRLKSYLQHERHNAAFKASAEADWNSWRATNASKSEKAVTTIYSEIAKITKFRAQIWPK